MVVLITFASSMTVPCEAWIKHFPNSPDSDLELVSFAATTGLFTLPAMISIYQCSLV
jgi:hypothetical protein